MNLPGIIELARGQAVFEKYQDGKLWYSIPYGWHEDPLDGSSRYLKTFTFPIPVDDAGGGEFLPADKALTFMRWIRKHLEFLRASLEGDVQ